MASDLALVPLRRTIQPYVGQTLILIVVTAFAVWVSVVSSDWNFLWGPAVFLPVYGIYFLYFGLPYRVFWNEESVVMRAHGGPERCVRFDEITSIRSEVSSAEEVAAQSRPFRRIAIYGREGDANARVDISLRHFERDDIDQLLSTIQKCRPDLDVPVLRGAAKSK